MAWERTKTVIVYGSFRLGFSTWQNQLDYKATLTFKMFINSHISKGDTYAQTYFTVLLCFMSMFCIITGCAAEPPSAASRVMGKWNRVASP